ncbi:MAG TPA: ROK family protein [Acidimicrobiia bacterium]|jgi:predicted NBD/HSP70 family sugar kinase
MSDLMGGIDIGGTTIDSVVLGPDRTVLGRDTRPTLVMAGRRLIDSVLESFSEALAAAGETIDQIAAVGVGVPGRVDPETGSVHTAVNLGIGEEGFPVGPELAHALAVPVTVENDARVAAVGAADHYGDGTPVRHLVYLGLGTGVSAGILRDGQLVRGSHGLAGEIGHVPVFDDGAICSCGLVGCLETVISGPAISKAWPQVASDHARHMFAMAEEGREGARRIADDVAKHVATAVQWLAAVHDPSLIVVGGGVAVSGGRALADRVVAVLASRVEASSLGRRLFDPARLRFATGEVPIGAVGAAALAHQRFTTVLADRAISHAETGGGT